MRLFLIVSIVASATISYADDSRYTPLVDIRSVDADCRVLAEVPHNARISGPSYDAAISTANCMANIRAQRLVVTPTAASVAALDDAVAPSLRILDRVIATGDAAHALLAQYAKVDILEGDVARVLLAMPQLSPQMSEAEVTDHDKLVWVVDDLTQPWRHRALQCRRELARLAYKHPELATRDAVLAHAIANSRIVEAAGLAAR